MRLGLLASISWLVTLTQPLFEVFDKSFSGRDLIMLFGGVFLLFKATMELHERLEGHVASARAMWPMRCSGRSWRRSWCSMRCSPSTR
jgi:predicted tellurium resistance membrane protein TerC